MRRPVLVLGAGGARGFAHIGFLRALEEENIRPRAVVGCSMGALVGGLWALLGDSWRVEAVFREMQGEVDPLNPNEVLGFFRRVFGQTQIEELGVGFGAVAVDISGSLAKLWPGAAREVFMRRGSLFLAVAASMATPAIFRPVATGGRVLVDGGVLDPLPVLPAREAFGGPIISVEPRMVDKRLTLAKLAFLPWGYEMWASRRRAQGASDLHFSISLRMGSLEFHRGEEAGRAGYWAAKAKMEEIKGLLRG